MAEGLSWSSVELQLENLVPGIMLSTEILAWSDGRIERLAGLGFIGAVAFVAGSYGIGLVSAILSRAILDSVSEWRVRSWIFERWVHDNRADLLELFRGLDSKFEIDYRMELSRRSETAAQWNSIYRSAVRTTTRKNEVDRRRAQGRLTRNLMFPLVLGAIHLVLVPEPAVPLSIVGCVVAVLFAFVLSTALYSYAELIVMAEAFDASTEREVGGGSN